MVADDRVLGAWGARVDVYARRGPEHKVKLLMRGHLWVTRQLK